VPTSKMIDPLENDLFGMPDYEHTDDENFPPLPPPRSPGGREDHAGDVENGDDLDDWTRNMGESQPEEAPKPVRRAVKRPQPKLDANRGVFSTVGYYSVYPSTANVKRKILIAVTPTPVVSQTPPADPDEIPEDFDEDLLEEVDSVVESSTQPAASSIVTSTAETQSNDTNSEVQDDDDD
ncbi:hypothetical protein AB205_0045690, partial [Aquarana catesbeiana]